MINLWVERKYRKEAYTIGDFRIEDKFFCNTLEDKDRDFNKDGDLLDPGETKIFGETAIPYGRYRVTVVFSQKLQREVPYLHSVNHFTGILIHKVASALGTLGCIGIGFNTSPGRLTGGKKKEEELTAFLKAAIAKGEEVFINIV